MVFWGHLSPSIHQQASSSQNISVFWKRQRKPRKPEAVREILRRGSSSRGKTCSRFSRFHILFFQPFFQELKLPVGAGKGRCTYSCGQFLNCCCCYFEARSRGCLLIFAQISSNLRTQRLGILATPFSTNLPMQHSQPLPALETAEIPTARVGDWILSLGCNWAEPRPPHRSADNTHFQKNPAVQILTSLIQSTGSTLDSVVFVFVFKFCYGVI